MMNIVVYGKPECNGCKFTRAMLDKMILLDQLPGGYEYIDITTDKDAADDVRTMGYLVLPVVIAGSEQWCGFRPDKLNALKPAGGH